MVHAYNPRTREAEAEQPGLHKEILSQKKQNQKTPLLTNLSKITRQAVATEHTWGWVLEFPVPTQEVIHLPILVLSASVCTEVLRWWPGKKDERLQCLSAW